MSFSKQSLNIGGIALNVYSQTNATELSTPVNVLFMLHGRTGSAKDVEWVAQSILQWIDKQRSSSTVQAEDLVIVTLDQRNHGARVVDQHGNGGWRGKARNDRHAVDMYAIYTGTAKDVSFVIDFLPSYLYPSEERTIAKWMVAGISLGGHATWYTLRNEPRVKIGIPIIGCPDYITLMTDRAQLNGIPFEPPYIPKSLLALIGQYDAVAAPYTSAESANPFLGKKVLVLSGAEDKLVPWSASKVFVDNLYVGEAGVKKVILAPGVGHECTPNMVQAMSEFLWAEALSGSQ